MFEVIPAVDIQRGRAVRLVEGRAEDETVYFDDPLEAARKWASAGAAWLHLVDLDAAFGNGDNREVLGRLAEKLDCRLEVGGGVRSAEAAEGLLEIVDRVILGTAAITYTDIARDGTLLGVDPEPVSLMRAAFPHTLVAGGGVAGESDLELYESLGLDGAVVGKALYEGRIRYPRTP